MPPSGTEAVEIPPRLERWLLAADEPSVRLRVLTELRGRPASHPAVVAARRAIGRRGWAAAILAEQLPGGQWLTPGTSERELYVPKYLATNWRLLVLAELGASGRDPRVAKAVRLFLRRFGNPKSDSLGGAESHLCFTGNAARLLLRLGYGSLPAVRRSIDWLVRAQKTDGGWHCFPSRTGTLDGWEALGAFAAIPAPERSPAVTRAIERGAEFYLSRALLREGPPYPPWYRLHFPNHYYYDLLVGLDLLTQLGYAGDRRLRAPVRRLTSMRDAAGRWTLDGLHPDLGATAYDIRAPFYPMAIEPPGRPSRWLTTTALTVLDRVGRASAG